MGWWDYEEWQGTGSVEGGGMGSLHFVEQQIPEDVNVTYLNLDMFALNWPVPTPAISQASGCDEDFWTLYMFTSPVDDWSYYEDRGLEVTESMRKNAATLQNQLKDANQELEHPTEWVRVIDDTKGNSDHFNFIMHGYAATWLRGQHEYIMEEGDTCEQTPKHAQSDSVTTINTMAGGRTNVESGLQTGLDVIATLAMWDRNDSTSGEPELIETQSSGLSIQEIVTWSVALLIVAAIITTVVYKKLPKDELND